MFDPVSISASVAVASTAFNGIKRAFQAGRDLESMSQDLSRWMGAVSDVDNAHKSAKNPSLIRKVFGSGSIEQYLMFTHGSKAWEELLQMEGQIRKRRQKEIYDKQQFREKVITWVVVSIVVAIGSVVLIGFVYTLMGFDRGWWVS